MASNNSPIIEKFDDLLLTFQKGMKPKADWRIGTEHEKLVFTTELMILFLMAVKMAFVHF